MRIANELWKQHPWKGPEALLQRLRDGLTLVPLLQRSGAGTSQAFPAPIYGEFADALAGRSLSERQCRLIELASAPALNCPHCIEEATARAECDGMDPWDILHGLGGMCSDPREAAAMDVAWQVAARRCALEPEALERLRAAGFDERQVTEVVAHSARRLFEHEVAHFEKRRTWVPAMTGRVG